MSSRYLIDGYNLIHALGFLYPHAGADGLHRSRLRLFHFLLEAFGPDAPQITIVFDAARAPPGVKPVHDFQGLHIRFALEHDEADDLIEELLAAESQPAQLVVVSSDHRLLTAARRRSVVGWNCMELLDHLEARKRTPPATEAARPEKDDRPSPEETAHWTREFKDLENDPAFKELFDPWPFEEE